MNIPPQEIETEESIIASVLTNDKIFKDCEYLDPMDFYTTTHQEVFRIMKALYVKKERIDLVTVGAALLKDDNGKIAVAIANLHNTANLSMNLKTHAKIIKGASTKRKLLITLSDIKQKIFSNNVENVLDYAQSEIMGYKITRDQGKVYHIKDLIIDQLNKIEKNNTTNEESGIKTGFKSLDKWITLKEKAYCIIAGRPSMGKTAFALTIMKNMAMGGHKTGIISLEMGKGKLLNRWLAMITGINSMNFDRFKGLDKEQFQDLSDAASVIYDLWDVLISDAPAKDIESVERQARQMGSENVEAIFIDQLNQIGAKSDDDVKNFTKHSHRIDRLAKELNIPIFLLAQLNRKLEDRSDKEPRLSDLKMSGSLEEDPDLVFLLYRPEYYEKDIKEKKKILKDVVINIAKNRDGITYRESDVIIFDKGRTLFEEDFSRINGNN